MSQLRSSTTWLFLLTMLAIGIRLPQVHDSLWLDELHSAWVVAGPFAEVAERAQLGNQSPLYFYLVKLSVAVLGLTEIGMRFPSLVGGTALVPLVFLVAARWTQSRVAAIVAGAIVAVDHHCVFYAQEARPYALVQLVGLLHVVLFLRLQRAPTKRTRLVFVVATAVLFYLHYTAALLFLGEAVWYAIHRIWKPVTRGYAPWQLVADFAIAAVMCSPALPHLVEIAGRRENWSAIVTAPSLTQLSYMFSLPVYVFWPFAGAASIAIVDSWNCGRRSAAGVTEATAEESVPGATMGNSLVQTTHRFLRPPCWLVVCWFVVPVGLTWAATVTDVAPLFMRRYLIVTVLAPVLLCALQLGACPRGRLQVLLATVVVAFAIHSSGMIAQWRRDGRLVGDRNQGWRAAVAFLQDQRDGSTYPVFVRSGLLEADDLGANDTPMFREYCLSPVRGIYALEADRWTCVPLANRAAGKLHSSSLEAIGTVGGAWFLVNGTKRSRRQIESDVRAAISSVGWNVRVKERRLFGDVEVVGFVVP